MKRLDWIILTLFAIVVIGTAVWYFFFKKAGSGQSLANPPTGSASGSNAANPSSATAQGVDISKLPYGSLPLKQGDVNQLVALLQRALNYLGANLVIDGNFGPATKAALQTQVGGATVVTYEVALSLATQINNRNGDGSDPLASYIIGYLQKMQ